MRSPLGMFAPGFKELGDYFDNMAKDIESELIVKFVWLRLCY